MLPNAGTVKPKIALDALEMMTTFIVSSVQDLIETVQIAIGQKRNIIIIHGCKLDVHMLST